MGARAAHFGQTSTGPECGAKQPHPRKEHFRLRISTSLYIRKHGRIRKFACQHKVLPSIQCLPMFTFPIQEDTNQPKGCLSQDRLSPGCVAAPWPGAAGWVGGCVGHLSGVLPSASHCTSWSHLTSLQEFTSVVIRHLCGWCILNPT